MQASEIEFAEPKIRFAEAEFECRGRWDGPPVAYVLRPDTP